MGNKRNVRKTKAACRAACAVLAAAVLSLALPARAQAREWDPYDHRLIYSEAEWSSFSREAQFSYICGFLDEINDMLGLQGAQRVTEAQVHLISPSDPSYQKVYKACTLRDNHIYLNMDKLKLEGYGAGYALIVLAHEMKHVQQNLAGTVDWGMAAAVDYSSGNFDSALYEDIPHEKEAQEFGLAFPAACLKPHWDGMRARGVVFND